MSFSVHSAGAEKKSRDRQFFGCELLKTLESTNRKSDCFSAPAASVVRSYFLYYCNVQPSTLWLKPDQVARTVCIAAAAAIHI
jgi:hypothetical protein